MSWQLELPPRLDRILPQCTPDFRAEPKHEPAADKTVPNLQTQDWNEENRTPLYPWGQVFHGPPVKAFDVPTLLARLKLDRPEDVFNICFPRPTLSAYIPAKELYPGKHRPMITMHSFARWRHKSLLEISFTRNFDTLERRASFEG